MDKLVIDNKETRLLDQHDAAKELKIHESKLYQYRRTGYIHPIKDMITGYIRYPYDQVTKLGEYIELSNMLDNMAMELKGNKI